MIFPFAHFNLDGGTVNFRIAILFLAFSVGAGSAIPAQDAPASSGGGDTAQQNSAQNVGERSPEVASEMSPLGELAWLAGTWVNKSPSGSVSFHFETIGTDSFLRNQFTVEADGVTGLRGVQVIGWDPIARSIRSWTFDSEGGFGEASWSKKDGRWFANTSFTRRDGSVATAINVFEKQDENQFTWKSVSREIDGALQPTIPATTFVRQTESADHGKAQANTEKDGE